MKVKTIRWRDSRMYITQCGTDEDWDVCVITSVGFVLKETKKYIVLCGDLVDDEVRRAIVIPKENICK